jgi:heme/copper-type cytochrome/quinol oxidase subunit 4
MQVILNLKYFLYMPKTKFKTFHVGKFSINNYHLIEFIKLY